MVSFLEENSFFWESAESKHSFGAYLESVARYVLESITGSTPTEEELKVFFKEPLEESNPWVFCATIQNSKVSFDVSYETGKVIYTVFPGIGSAQMQESDSLLDEIATN